MYSRTSAPASARLVVDASIAVDDHVDAGVERHEGAVGDQRRDLDDHVTPDVEAGHLEVEPDEPVVSGGLGHLVTLTNRCVIFAGVRSRR